MEGSSDKLFCCRWVRNKVPLAYRDELYHILRMTGPLLVSRVLNFLLPFVVTIFCGRLGNEVMGAYGLATNALNLTAISIGTGLGLTCNTLVSQTFGGKNLLRVGVILQRGTIILLLFCLPCCGLLLNSEAILLHLGQDPEVARIAQLYIIIYLPALPAMFLYQLQVSYLQNQDIILPQVYTAVLANIANLLTNYVFIHWLDMGVSGSAAANTLSQIYVCAFLFAYIWWKKLHVKTWGGWSVESLQEWGSYMKLAIPSTLMICFEWWVYEFGGFFAGMVGEDDLAAQHAAMMVAFITYMFPLGIQAAACARIGNALGAGDTARAILTCKMSLTVFAIFAFIEGVVIASTKTVIGYIFTSDEKVIGLVSNLMNVYCVSQFFDGVVCVCAGIFMGTGKQKIPAVANLIGYYCIGVTLGLALMFVANLGVLGFWLGLLICVVIMSTFYIIVIFKLNWKTMTEEAVKRAQKKVHMTLLSEAAMSDTPGQTGSNCNSMDGYTSVRSEYHDGNRDTQGGHVVQQVRGGHLSLSQLILRRGLTMLAAVALLVLGACVHFFVPLPEPLSYQDSINTTYSPDQNSSTVLVVIEQTM